MNKNKYIKFLICLSLVVGSAYSNSGPKNVVKSKCEEGIGCYDGQKSVGTGLERDRSTSEIPRKKSNNSPGLGLGVTGDTKINVNYYDNPWAIATMSTATDREGVELRMINENNCLRRLQFAADEQQPGLSEYRALPELEASACIQLDDRQSGFGRGFKNTCNYPVIFNWCTYRPKKDSWAESFDCEKKRGGAERIRAYGKIAAHTANAERVYWGGCKAPEGLPTDIEFKTGVGLTFHCKGWTKSQQQTVVGTNGDVCNVVDNLIDAKTKEIVEQAQAEQAAFGREHTARNEQPRQPAPSSQMLKGPMPSSSNSRGMVRSLDLHAICRNEIMAWKEMQLRVQTISSPDTASQNILRWQRDIDTVIKNFFPSGFQVNQGPVSCEANKIRYLDLKNWEKNTLEGTIPILRKRIAATSMPPSPTYIPQLEADLQRQNATVCGARALIAAHEAACGTSP